MKVYYDDVLVTGITHFDFTAVVDGEGSGTIRITDADHSTFATWVGRRWKPDLRVDYDDDTVYMDDMIVESVRAFRDAIELEVWSVLRRASYGVVDFDDNFEIATHKIETMAADRINLGAGVVSDDEYNGLGLFVTDVTTTTHAASYITSESLTRLYNYYGSTGVPDTETNTHAATHTNNGTYYTIAHAWTGEIKRAHAEQTYVEADFSFDCSALTNPHFVMQVSFELKFAAQAGKTLIAPIRLYIRNQTKAAGAVDAWEQLISWDTPDTDYTYTMNFWQYHSDYFSATDRVQFRVRGATYQYIDVGVPDLHDIQSNLSVDFLQARIRYDATSPEASAYAFTISDTIGATGGLIVDTNPITEGVQDGDFATIATKNQDVLTTMLRKYTTTLYTVDDIGGFCARNLRGRNPLQSIAEVCDMRAHYWVWTDRTAKFTQVLVKTAWTDNAVTLGDVDVDPNYEPGMEADGEVEYDKVLVFGGRIQVGETSKDVEGQAVSSSGTSPRVLVINDPSLRSDSGCKQRAEDLLAEYETTAYSYTLGLKDNATTRAIQPGEKVAVSTTNWGLDLAAQPVYWVRTVHDVGKAVEITIHLGRGSTPREARLYRDISVLKKDNKDLRAALMVSIPNISGVTRYPDLTNRSHGNTDHSPDFIGADGSVTVTADIPFNNNKLTGVKDPTANQDAATKKYVNDQDVLQLTITDIDDVPVNGVTNAPISSNWAHDHKADVSAHHVKYTDAEVQALSINNVSEDATPTLGGNLDANSKDVTSGGRFDFKQPFCHLTRSSTWTHTSNGGYLPIAFNSETSDLEGMHDNATNPSRVTIPAGLGGLYVVDYFIFFQTNTILVFVLKVNGTWQYNYHKAAGPYGHHSYTITLAAGDYLEMGILQEGGGNNTTDATMHPWARVTRIATGGSS